MIILESPSKKKMSVVQNVILSHSAPHMFILLVHMYLGLIAICCFAEVGFFLRGTFLPNNSIVLLNDIGEGSSALFCLTDRVACCSGQHHRGLWKYPNSSLVRGSTGTIYRTRGSSSILLNRKSSATRPTGIFRCDIPNENGIIQNISIGIYSHTDEGQLT